MDIFDQATELEERHRAAALAHLATSLAQPTRESAIDCEDCGEPIPEARRRAVPGCIRCIECQERVEK